MGRFPKNRIGDPQTWSEGSRIPGQSIHPFLQPPVAEDERFMAAEDRLEIFVKLHRAPVWKIDRL
jgi:hypothetical protein